MISHQYPVVIRAGTDQKVILSIFVTGGSQIVFTMLLYTVLLPLGKKGTRQLDLLLFTIFQYSQRLFGFHAIEINLVYYYYLLLLLIKSFHWGAGPHLGKCQTRWNRSIPLHLPAAGGQQSQGV